jgi:hypothetical protein
MQLVQRTFMQRLAHCSQMTAATMQHSWADLSPDAPAVLPAVVAKSPQLPCQSHSLTLVHLRFSQLGLS